MLRLAPMLLALAALLSSCLTGELETGTPDTDAPRTDSGVVADVGSAQTDGDTTSDVGIDVSGPTCGDGVVSDGELCDGDCPQACDDGNTCTADQLSGAAAACAAVCSNTDITMCADGDSCCPTGCDASTDSDCSASCGDGIVDANETCDQNCPTTCDDGLACTTGRLTGTPDACNVQCSTTAVTACVSGDGCCPSACNELNDDDCAAVCGNGVVEGGETCDGACPNCEDGVACTTDVTTGTPQTCDVACANTPITACVDGDGCCAPGCNTTNDDDCNATCGNGVIEGGELCDPVASCPTACDDSDACTADSLVGAAQTCNSVCTYAPITACTDGDGCCPNGCNANTDDDCAPVCGNSIAEPGETCDPAATCPTSCNDADACTSDTLTGSAAACTAACTYTGITACVDGDNCCPTGCTYAMDDDCPIVIDCKDPSTWPSGWASLETAIFNETNARRTAPQTCTGTSYPAAPALLSDARLNEAARCHALDMATNNFFSHTGTGGTSASGRATASGYIWNAIGENIAAGNATAVSIVNQWMNSTSGHCESVMNPTYEDLGIGYAYDQSATYDHYSVQVFGRD